MNVCVLMIFMSMYVCVNAFYVNGCTCVQLGYMCMCVSANDFYVNARACNWVLMNFM